MASTEAAPVNDTYGYESLGLNPFVCNICQKTYGRIDHLARHFRSHTNEKPFKCQECGKAFARADLLKRHGILHLPSEQSGRKRKLRASQACAACAAIKVKCDHEKPCKRCRLKGLECRVDNTASSRSRSDSNISSDHASASPQQNDRQHSSPANEGIEMISIDPMAALTPISADGVLEPSVQPLNATRRSDEGFRNTESLSLGHFLRDVFQSTQTPNFSTVQYGTEERWHQHDPYTVMDLMDFSQDFNMDFNDLDKALESDRDNWLHPASTRPAVDRSPGGSYTNTASIHESIDLGTAAYERSAWQWSPGQGEGIADHTRLASILTHAGPDTRSDNLPDIYRMIQPLQPQQRDCVIALLLAVCEKVSYQKIITLFPALNVLDMFLNDYLLTVEHSIDNWIHIPTLSMKEIPPELLTFMIAGGAILGPTAHAQRFGYTLQEIMRSALPGMFENDNSKTRDLRALQAFAICLDIGTWSGNKRTMELAESQVSPLITMLRRSGRFRRPRSRPLVPSADDSPSQLEKKWRAWVEAESFKRLAYHVFLYSVQVSIAFQTPPLVSYGEITLELPAPQTLWRARTASEWRERYGLLDSNTTIPSFIASMRDAQTIGLVRADIDLELTLYLILLSHWCLAWEFMQMSAANKFQAPADAHWAGTFLASSKGQELRNLLDSFHVEIESWNIVVPKEVHMVSQLLRMNLCVAFGDLQILAGKEGQEEARRVLPALMKWYHSTDCREAIWHAGQTLRAARRPAWRSPENASCAPHPNAPWLRDFNAVALYHAGLTLWVYGLLSRAVNLNSTLTDHSCNGMECGNGMSHSYNCEQLIYLDVDDGFLPSLDRHSFISLEQGRPVLSASSLSWADDTANSVTFHPLSSPQSISGDMMALTDFAETIPLDDPKRVMEVLIHDLSPPNLLTTSSPARPAMVENLMQLMRDLGEAASVLQ